MLTTDSLIRLMTLLSPSFPVGAFTYSHGLEHAVEAGRVSDEASLKTWVEGALLFGAGKTDGFFFREAWRAAQTHDLEALNRVCDEAYSFRPTSEMALESEAQGRAFVSCILDVTEVPGVKDWQESCPRYPSYSVAVGAVCGFADIPLEKGLGAFLHAFAANIISAGVRVIPLGQTSGQRALIGLESVIGETIEAVLALEARDLGSAAPMIDLSSMNHETQYTRLFRS